MFVQFFSRFCFPLILLAMLTACGGGGGGDGSSVTATATGYFKDANVSGVSYVSGNLSGVTGVDGAFEYVVGENVTFSIGELVLGTTEGALLVTPVDLVGGSATSDSPDVLNIVRLLMVLDADGDAENGILISSELLEFAEQNPGAFDIDLTAQNFTNEIDGLVTTLNNSGIDQRVNRIITSAQAAVDHLETTLRCAYSGLYGGSYMGASSGDWNFVIEPQFGLLFGVGQGGDSRFYAGNVTEFAGSGAVIDGAYVGLSLSNPGFALGDFNGVVDADGSASGSWDEDSSNSGQFSAQRTAGDSQAYQRIVGFASDELPQIDIQALATDPQAQTNFALALLTSDMAVLVLDVDQQGVVSGTLLDVVSGNRRDVTGTLDATDLTLELMVDDGRSFSGVLDPATGVVRSAQVQGSFAATSCILNP